MAKRDSSKLWSVLAGAVLTASLLSILGSTQVQGVVRACCFGNGTCEDLSRSICEDQQGGIAQEPGNFCDTVVCPVLCGSSAPECNGQCDGNSTCVSGPVNGTTMQAGGAPPVGCECVPEIPLGEACAQQPDACAGGLPCEDGVCCETVCATGMRCDLPGTEGVCTAYNAHVPLASNTGLFALAAVLIAAGTLTLVRRRRTE